jgi:Protein of unknown function (DUF3703)
MNSFARRIRPHVDLELQAADRADAAGDSKDSFARLERAHVLGQASTLEHVRVHWRMLRWAWRHGVASEARGQVLRIVGAATKTAFGLVPSGNTGGANVSPFKPLPVPDELARIIAKARGA